MEKIITSDILKQAIELATEHHLYHNSIDLAYKMNKRRIRNAPPKIIYKPEEWTHNKRHNPFYVIKRYKQIGRSVSKKIMDMKYIPNPPVIKRIKKSSGGYREVSVYEIPDSAVSDRFYHNLLSKNKHRFSPMSYAYRNDRNVHFAIQDIALEFKMNPRVFVAEFDFSDFFGSINHSFLYNQLQLNGFLISSKEDYIIRAFLNTRNGRGIPLGTSISLFLANVACWKLDRSLENEGLRFARYADDTIIWSTDYNRICKAFEIINSFSIESGIKINLQKSKGISLLQSKLLKGEIITKESIDFLGYKISNSSVSIKEKSKLKIKKQISYLLYRNLIQPFKTVPFTGIEFPSNNLDKNLVTAVMQIRRYLYGNLTEITLKKYLNGTYKILSFKGIMSFYPLINDVEQMKQLDKWLISTLINVISLRRKLLLNLNPNFNVNQFPFNVEKEEIVDRFKTASPYRKAGLLEIPSFLRIFKAMQIGINEEGIERVMNPKANGYYDF